MSEQRNDNPNQQGPPRNDWGDRKYWRDNRREWRHNDPLRGLFPALFLILLGILMFLAIQGFLDWGSTFWQFLLIGMGLIFILDGFIHYFIPSAHHIGAGRFIPGIILVLIGVALLVGFSNWWPLILVGVGIAILIGMLFRRR